MINDDTLGKFKQGAILINTARGEIVDQEALCRALESGRLGGAGLDVLTPEPVTPDNPVLRLPPDLKRKVALSPHIGGITSGALQILRHRLGKYEKVERGAARQRSERPLRPLSAGGGAARLIQIKPGGKMINSRIFSVGEKRSAR